MNKINLVILVLAGLCALSWAQMESDTWPEAETPLGSVYGLIGKTAFNEYSIYNFNHIPYGKTKPFKAPEKYGSFGESYHAKTFGYDCPGTNNVDDEDVDYENRTDCLYLNIHTKYLMLTQPVMIYLTNTDVCNTGSTNENLSPDFMLEEDIVLVTIQYRTGPFGFISTLTDDIPGNMGILDIILALRWVKDNIASFGGDAEKITLFGQYDAAAIINALTISPLLANETLFHNVIYQSGSVFKTNITTNDPVEIARAVANEMYCESETVDQINNCIIEGSTTLLLQAYKRVCSAENTVPFITIGGPSGVLEDDPRTLVENKKHRAYPTMGGTVKHVGYYLLDKSTVEEKIDGNLGEAVKSMIENMFEKLLENNTNTYKYSEIIDEQFPKKIYIRLILKALKPTLIDFAGYQLKSSIAEALKFNMEIDGNSYLYTFNYDGSLGETKDASGIVSLLADNNYLFPFGVDSDNISAADKSMISFMTKLWAKFAENGYPEAHSLHNWPGMVKGSRGPYLHIDTIHEVGFDFYDEMFGALKDQYQALSYNK